MTRPCLSFVLAAVLCSAVACQKTTGSSATGAAVDASTAPTTNGTTTANGSLTSSARPDATAAAPVTTASSGLMADADFVTQAASGGMMEVEAAKQAQKSSDATVRGVADMILKDHPKTNDELKALAAKKDIKLPPGPIGEAKTTLDKLMAASGKEFDRLYLDEMNMAHDKSIALFDKQSKSGQDADLRAFAARTLPKLQDHAAMIKKHQKMQ